MQPSGLGAGAQAWRDLKGHGGVYANDTWWATYLKVRDADAAVLKRSLGDGTTAPTAIVHFWGYLADPAVWGPTPLQRLDEVVRHFNASGIRTLLFIGDPEFGGRGTWDDTHDVVRNLTARRCLKANIVRALQMPVTSRVVAHVSVYWLGGSSRCNGMGGLPKCSSSDIAGYNADLGDAIRGAGMHFLAHVDGPFWDGCWPQPCSTWDVAGYGPASLNRAAGVDGIMAESWTMGSLLGGARRLLSDGTAAADTLLLLNDVPNCDLDPAKKCSTGSVASDTAAWFAWLDELELTSWGVWDLFDGGMGDENDYGDGLDDGTGLTSKGRLHRMHGGQFATHLHEG